MMKYDKKTLDHFRDILNDDQKYGTNALYRLYDELEDYNIPNHRDGDIYTQLHDFMTDLAPEVIDWFERRTKDPPSDDLFLLSVDQACYLDYIKPLIKEYKLTAFVPFLVDIFNRNKVNVIKQILFVIKHQLKNETQFMRASHSRQLINHMKNIRSLGIDWPELDTIIASISRI